MKNTKNQLTRIQTTKITQNSFQSWLFLPENTLRFIWEIFMLILVLYLGITVPFFLAFKDPNAMPMFLEYIITGFYLLDIAINLNTAVYIKGFLSLNRTEIFKEYFRFWFWIDSISALPIDLIVDSYLSQPQNNSYLKTVRLIKFIRVFKLVKLIKLSKLKYTIAKIEDRITSKKLMAFLLIFKLQTYIFLIAHLLGCLMFSISTDTLSPDTFVSDLISRCENFTPGTVELYISSIYWAYTTMVSIGYGDISPQNSEERLFGILCMLMSSVTFGIILGNIASIIEKNGAIDEKKRQTITSVNKYIKYHKVNKDLALKVRMFVQYSLESLKNEEIDLYYLLSLLSEPLREEIYMSLNGEDLYSFTLFTNFPLVFTHKISRLMHSEIYGPDDNILKEDAPPIGLFFIQSGKVEIVDRKTHSVVKILSIGNHFGEIGLFTRNSCCASVNSSEYTEVLLISCENFDKVLNTFPSALKVYEEIKSIASTGDLTVLGVECYLCKAIGHVAKKCTVIQHIRDQTKDTWLESKQNSKILTLKTNIKRYTKMKKNTKDLSYGMKNVKGIKEEPENLFVNKEKLIRAANQFLNSNPESDTCQSLGVDVGFNNKYRKYSGISSVVDNSDDEETEKNQFEITFLGHN